MSIGGLTIHSQIQINNDEFSNTSTLVNWNNINETEGWNITQLEKYNIGDTVPGSLFMLPQSVGPRFKSLEEHKRP